MLGRGRPLPFSFGGRMLVHVRKDKSIEMPWYEACLCRICDRLLDFFDWGYDEELFGSDPDLWWISDQLAGIWLYFTLTKERSHEAKDNCGCTYGGVRTDLPNSGPQGIVGQPVSECQRETGVLVSVLDEPSGGDSHQDQGGDRNAGRSV